MLPMESQLSTKMLHYRNHRGRGRRTNMICFDDDTLFCLWTGTPKEKGSLKRCRICMSDPKKTAVVHLLTPGHVVKLRKHGIFLCEAIKRKQNSNSLFLFIISPFYILSSLPNLWCPFLTILVIPFLPAPWQLTCFAPFLPRPSPMSLSFTVFVKYICHSIFPYITSRVHQCAVLLGGSIRFLLNL